MEHILCVSAGGERADGEGGLGESDSDSSGCAAWGFRECSSCFNTLLLRVRTVLDIGAAEGLQNSTSTVHNSGVIRPRISLQYDIDCTGKIVGFALLFLNYTILISGK